MWSGDYLQNESVTNNIQISVSAPGKVILHGDHSVVYGKLAIAASLDLRTKIDFFVVGQPNTFTVQSNSLNFSYTFPLDKIKSLCFEILPLLVKQKEYCWEYPNLINHEELVKRIEHFLDTSSLSISTTHLSAVKAAIYLCVGIIGSSSTEMRPALIVACTDLNIGAGMGSSASFSVCLAAAYVQYVKSQISIDNFSKNSYKLSHWKVDLKSFNEKELDLICQWSFCAEKIIHGTPSGLDNTICTYGSMVQYRKGSPPKIFTISCSLELLLINTNVPRETRKLVAIAASNYNKFPDIFNNILEAMEATSLSALKNYKDLSKTPSEEDTDIYANLCHLFSINHGLLNSLGVGHSKLDEIIGILSEVGLKGKLTGAGGGGYAICLIPSNFDYTSLQTAIQILASKGYGVLRCELGVEGVKLESLKDGNCAN